MDNLEKLFASWHAPMSKFGTEAWALLGRRPVTTKAFSHKGKCSSRLDTYFTGEARFVLAHLVRSVEIAALPLTPGSCEI